MKKLLIILTILFIGCTDQLGEDVSPINVPGNNILTGTITAPITTLTSDKTWILKGYVYVANGSEIKIQPGTKIVSDISEKGALIIERGAKIYAEGTIDNPIVFTSGKVDGEKSPGDWGGIVILGNAVTNRVSEPIIEGGIGKPYGGTNNFDNSGVLKYVRIEYAGIAALPNSEINALTLAGVGSGTTIEYIQTIYANDDAFEFFGGTVSPKYLYSYATADDDYDFDFGFTGTLTNIIAKRDPKFVDAGDAGNGIECDNDGNGTLSTPFTHPIIDNALLIGPNLSESLPNHNLGLRFRRSTHFTVKNSTIYGYMKGGFSLESDETAGAYNSNISSFTNNKIGAFNADLNFISKSPVITSADVKEKALNEGNTEITGFAITLPNWINGWTRTPDKGF